MKTILKKTISILLLLILLTGHRFIAEASNTVGLLSLNTPTTLTAPQNPYTVKSQDNRLSKYHYKNIAPYVVVQKIRVTPGESYTLKVVFSGDKTYSNVELTGENPYSKSTSQLTYSGLTPSLMGYKGSVVNLTSGYSHLNTFTVDPNSTGEFLYVIGHFEQHNLSIGIEVISPPLTDTAATATGNKQGSTTYTAPIKLTKMPDDFQQIKLKINSDDALINGSTIKLDVAPTIKSGTTMVPLRFISEQLGATVEWEAKTKKITYTQGKQVIELWIGKTTANVNGQEVVLLKAPYITDGRTLVPLRFVIENLGGTIQWFEKTQEIMMTY